MSILRQAQHAHGVGLHKYRVGLINRSCRGTGGIQKCRGNSPFPRNSEKGFQTAARRFRGGSRTAPTMLYMAPIFLQGQFMPSRTPFGPRATARRGETVSMPPVFAARTVNCPYIFLQLLGIWRF